MLVLLLFYTPVAKRFGMIRTFQCGILVSFVSLALFPLLNNFANNTPLLWTGFCCRTCFVVSFFFVKRSSQDWWCLALSAQLLASSRFLLCLR
jgi:hypothetical protein